jgi:hypothetical protein
MPRTAEGRPGALGETSAASSSVKKAKASGWRSVVSNRSMWNVGSSWAVGCSTVGTRPEVAARPAQVV